MTTDDVTEHSVKCPCGESTVTFITSSPNHPWGRASQTRYSATIDCKECRKKYAVHQESHNDQPVIVHRDDVDAKKAAQERYRAADEAIKQSEEAERLHLKIISAIDNETSMAARHRKLSEFTCLTNLLVLTGSGPMTTQKPSDGFGELTWLGSAAPRPSAARTISTSSRRSRSWRS